MNTTPPDKPQLDALTELLTMLVQALVSKPDKVKVEYFTTGPLAAFVITPDQDDVRRVVGKQGKHFRAIQHITSTICKEMGRECHVSINETNPGAARVTGHVRVTPPTDFWKVQQALERLVRAFLMHPSAMRVESVSAGTIVGFSITVAREDYAHVRGRDASFDYGIDGITIGSIKNLFDGIGKNYGRVIRITLSAPRGP